MSPASPASLEPLEPRTLLAASLFASLPSTDLTNPSGIATDPQGNVYLAGLFKGTIDVDPSSATANLTARSDADVYLAKYSRDGALLWSRQWSVAPGDALGHTTLATDSTGNVYLAGGFSSAFDANPSSATFTLTPKYSNANLFLIGLDPAGNFRTANRVATHHMDMTAVTLATDAPGHVYLLAQSEVPGRVQGDDMKVDTVLYQFKSSGRALRAYRWSTPTFWGTVYPTAMAVTPAGDVYLTGNGPQDVDYKPGRGVRHIDGGSQGDNSFLLHLTPAGQLAFALGLDYTQSSPPSFDALAVDALGNAVVAGRAGNRTDFNPSRRKHFFVAPDDPAGSTHTFVAKYAPDARLLAAANVSDNVEFGFPVDVDVDPKSGDVLVSGLQYPTSNPPVALPDKLQAKASGDLFLATYAPDLSFVSASGAATLDTLGGYFPPGPFATPNPAGGFYLTARAKADTLDLYPTPDTPLDLAGRTFILKLD